MIIDPAGRINYATDLYTKACFNGIIHARTDQTFYVRYGDIVGKICVGASLMMIITMIVQIKKKTLLKKDL